ncbi:MAG: extensin family protein, partial [Pseudomonadota bacterium]
ISGVVLTDGRRLRLLSDWDGGRAEAAFFREIRDGLCERFRVVLSPDYNALHADHFHVDLGRWRACR